MLTRRFQRALAATRQGFTLLELMVVMALIVVLAAIGMASYRNAVTLAREAVLKENLFRMRDAIDQYYADKQRYPAALEDLVTEGYMRAIPDDPITQSPDTWQTILSEPDLNNPGSDMGIYNVKSGSDRVSTSGAPYADW